MKNLNLRVYRRTQDNIALLWNKAALTKEQLENIEVYNVTDGEPVKLDFITSESMETVLEEGIVAPDETVVMLINHEKNKLDAYTDYKIRVVFDKTIQHEIFVFGFGVLPPTEKDDKQSNVHLYLWDEENRKWEKAAGIHTPEGFALLVKLSKK